MNSSYEWITVYQLEDGFRIYAFSKGRGTPKGECETRDEAMSRAELMPRKRAEIAFVDLREKPTATEGKQ